MFNWIVTTSLNNRLMVLALGLLLMIGGIWTSWHAPVDVFPDLNKPTVTVMTEAGGMAPQEVEQLISFPLETALNGMPGVTRIRSISGIGLSIVYAEFEWGSDLYRNRQLVAERIGLARERLPRDVNPIMGPVSSIMGRSCSSLCHCEVLSKRHQRRHLQHHLRLCRLENTSTL